MYTDHSQYLDPLPPDHPRRRSVIHIIIKLAHQSGQLPRSLFLENVQLVLHRDYQCGGFGDVYQATLNDQPVAVKKPRLVGGDSLAHKVVHQWCDQAPV
jgi:hypothetical protein